MKKTILLILMLFASLSFTYAQCGPGQNINQNVVTAGLVASSTEQGNSFVAPCTGQIESLTIRVFNVSAAGTATATIHAGDTGVNIIGTTTMNIPAAGGEITATFATPVPVTAGSTYTYMVDPGSISFGLSMGGGDPYPAGDNLRNSGGSFNPATSPDLDFRFIIGFVDEVDPTAVCSNFTAQLNATGSVTIAASDVDGGSTDDSGSVTLSVSPNTFNCANLGANTVTLTATDAAGNTDTCTATVTVVDNIGPTITCPSDITTSTDPGLCEANVTVPAPSAIDNCGSLSFASLHFDGANDEINVANGFGSALTETTIEARIFMETDSGFDVLLNYDGWQPGYLHFQMSNGNIGWSINNNTPTDQVVDAGLVTGQWYTISVVYSSITNNVLYYVDGVLAATRTYTTANPIVGGVPFNIGSWSNNRYFDGNIDELRVWNTVRTEPEILANYNATLTGSETGLVALYTFDEGTPCADNSGVTTLNDLAGGDNNGSIDNFDLSGGSGCDSNFDDPRIPSTLTVTNDFNGTSDASGTYPLGTTTVTWTVTDSGGNMASCTMDVTVEDNEAPVITCPADITVNNTVGLCEAVVTFADATATDSCGGGVTITQTGGPVSGSSFPVGDTTITYEAMDGLGNTATCSFTVTVIDAEAPTISCPTNITVDNDTGLCGANVTIPIPTVADNCGGFMTSIAGAVTPLVFDINDELADTPVVFAGATTASELVIIEINYQGDFTSSSECMDIQGPDGSQVFFGCDFVDDGDCGSITNPTFTVSAATWNSWITTYGSDLTFTLLADDNVDDGGCGDSGPANNFIQLIRRGNVNITNDQNDVTDASGFYPVGTTTVTFTATDVAGNSTSCTVDVTVNDVEAPSISCPSDITVNNDAGVCNALVTIPMPTTADNCPYGAGTSLVTVTGPVTSFNFNVDDELIDTPTTLTGLAASTSDVTMNFTVDGDFGGSSECFVLTGPDASTIFSECELTTSDCDTANRSLTISFATWNGWIATYGSDLTFTLLADSSVDGGFGGCDDTYQLEVITDTSSALIATNDFNGTADASGTYPIGTTTVTWTVTDLNGNSNTCTMNVTVNDVEAPTITCPADITADSDPGICGADVSVPLPVVADNCLACVQSDDIESFTLGQLYGQGGDWQTWTPDTPAQSFEVSNEQALSGTQSVKVEGVPSGGPTDMVYNLGNRSFGAWEVTFNLYIPSGNAAYTNIQKSETSGTQWANQIQYNSDGTADYNVNGGFTSFTFPQDAWFEVKYLINIDGDHSEFFIDGVSIISHPFRYQTNGNNGLMTLGSINFFPITNAFGNDPNPSAIPLYYVDDISLCPVAVNDYNNTADASDTYPVGTTNVVWTYTDVGGNVDSCTQVITVNDIEAPVVTSCPTDIAVDNDAGVCGAIVTYDTPLALDNCEATPITGFTYLGNYNGMAYYLSDGTSNAPNAFTSAEAQNGFAATITSQDHNDWLRQALDAQGAGQVIIGFTDRVTEGTFEWHSGDTSTYTNWRSGEPNDAGAGEDYTVIRPDGEWNDINSTVTRQYVIEVAGFPMTQTAGLPSGSEFPVGTTTNTFEITDAAGNTSTCSFDVTVNDTEDPVISCPTDIVTDNDLGLCGANVTVPLPDIMDNCFEGTLRTPFVFDGNGELADTPTVYFNAETASADVTIDILLNGDFNSGSECFELNGPDGSQVFFECDMDPQCGTFNRSFTVTQATWNGWITTFGTDLTFTLVADTSVDDLGSCESYYQLSQGTFSNITLTNDYNGGQSASDFYPVGTTLVTYTVEDGSGNTTTCALNVTVNDTEAPEVVCEDTTIQLDANGMASITADDVLGTALTTDYAVDMSGTFNPTDISATGTLVTLSDDQVSGALPIGFSFDFYGNTYTDFYISSNGFVTFNSSTDSGCCEGQQLPNTSTPNNLIALAWDDLFPPGAGSVSYETIGTAPDRILIIDFTDVPACCDSTPIVTSQIKLYEGSNIIEIHSADVTSNNGMTQGIENIDGTQATIVSGRNFDSWAVTNDYVAFMPLNPSDNCGVDTVVLSQTDFTCADVGDNTVTVTVTDVNGNVATCTSTVTVEDNIAPTVVCQDITVQLDANGMATITPADVDNGSSDACGVTLSLDIDTFDCSNVGANTVTLTATDPSGNSSTCTATVTVEDNVAPEAVCMDIDVFLDASGNASITPADVDGGSNDACGVAGLAIDITDFTCADVGPNDVTLTVTDNNGNVSSCVAVVTVIDNTAPVISCPADVVTGTDPGVCSAQVVFSDAIASDECGILSVVQTAGLPSGSDFPTGVNTIEFTATDVNGNTTVCSFTITVNDDEDPVAVCQDITIQLDDTGVATITADDVAGVNADNCGVASTSIDMDTFDCSNVGDNTVTLTVTDTSGNTSTCTAIVTVEDVTAPEVLCQDITIQLDDDGMATISATDIDNGSTDACGIDTYEVDIDTFDCSMIGDNTVTLTVTDVNGNSATCTATVTVEDLIDPVVACMDITVELDENGMAVITPEDVATISDNCGVLTTAIDIFEFSCDDVGTPVTVQIFANDASGNLSSCTAVVTVVDTLAPVITCPADQTVDPGPGMLFYEVPDYFATGEATAIDNCTDPVTVTSQDPAAGTLLPDGVYTITLTAEDEYGNASTCEFELTVESTLGLDDLPVDLSTIVVYPNPATDVVFISNPQSIALEEVTVFDLVGRKVASYDLRNSGIETSLDISNLATASYTLVIEGSGGQITKRLIKE
ncbi:HYR domain-containing protein [Aureisphaera galaxeae]|uniref:HYR domain-containing protein n=1 Tax=Aureisphaera galaxeae TaxID=1538023 RepID=UPI0023504899|nr:HYR domain-containing protein [Aureisphaera galaxeae]MDC8003310.1 HYR domain-containing protein [Aureisphaera galaxeae]